MPTPVFVCGAECGIAVVGTVSAVGTRHFSSVTGTAPTVSTTTFNSAGGGLRSFRFNPTAATSFLTHTFATAIGSPATMVGRFYVRFATLPSATTGLVFGAVYFHQPSSTLRGGESAGATASAGAAVTTGVWYRVDFKRVFNTTTTADIQVDGVAQTQYSAASSAAPASQIFFGLADSCTADVFIDDLVVSGTSGDYPIGAGSVAGLYPSADGAHGGGWATGTFGKSTSGATNAANTDTDIWSSLDNPLVSTAAGAWVSDLTGTVTTNYVNFVFGDLPAGASTVNGAMFVITLHCASTTASNHDFALADSTAGASASLLTGAFNVSTITIPIVVRNTDRAGSAWTPTLVNDARFRFSSTDSNPDVYLDGVCMEVDYVAVAAIPNKIVMVGQALNRAAVR